jgi:hypothetical protein
LRIENGGLIVLNVNSLLLIHRLVALLASSMLLMGKKMVVAERHWKLARHAVSGILRQIAFVPEGRWTFNAPLWSHFRRPFRTEFNSIAVPGTLSLANIQSRFATAESLNPLQTLTNPNSETLPGARQISSDRFNVAPLA